MIVKILSNPLRERLYTKYDRSIEKQYEVLVLLKDETQCTVWIPVDELKGFYNEYINK